MSEITEKGEKLERLYNEAKKGWMPEAEWFAMSSPGKVWVMESDYFTEEGIKAFREAGFQVKYVEVRKATEDEKKGKVHLHLEEKE